MFLIGDYLSAPECQFTNPYQLCVGWCSAVEAGDAAVSSSKIIWGKLG